MLTFDADIEHTTRSMRRLMRAFALLFFGLFAGLGGWAGYAEIESAVITAGKFIVKSKPQAVQHIEGGTVGAILVREGETVSEGQVVVRLDSSQITAELAIASDRLIDLTAERARLLAEQQAEPTIVDVKPPFELQSRGSAFHAALSLQQTLLTARLSGHRSQLSQLEERKRQTDEQIRGLDRVLRARSIETEQINETLVVQKQLDEKRLIRKSVLRETISQLARVRGDVGDIEARIASARSRLSELEFQIAELERNRRSEVLDKLKANQAQIAEVRERYTAARARTTNLEIRAPRAGIVLEMQVFTVGGVIRPGQTVMSIIPQDEPRIVSARVRPHEIDEVYPGQRATVRISAFKQRVTPELAAEIINISPDESTDERTGESFFSAQVAIEPDALAALNGKQLTPGLPADVLFHGRKRRVIWYLTQPLLDQMARVFKEE